jgi:hypothetical protein
VITFQKNGLKQEAKQSACDPQTPSFNLDKGRIEWSVKGLPYYTNSHKSVIKLTVKIIVGYHCYQLHTNFVEYFSLTVKSIHKWNYSGPSVDFDVTDQLLIRFLAFVIYWRTWEYNETVYQLFADFKKVYDSLRREVLYNILIEFEIPMKLVRLIKVRISET